MWILIPPSDAITQKNKKEKVEEVICIRNDTCQSNHNTIYLATPREIKVHPQLAMKIHIHHTRPAVKMGFCAAERVNKTSSQHENKLLFSNIKKNLFHKKRCIQLRFKTRAFRRSCS